MQVRIKRVQEENKGKYRVLKVTYDLDGKEKSQNVMSFGESETVFKTLQNASNGDAFEVTTKAYEKDGKTYNNWASVDKIEDIAPVSRPSENKSSSSGWRPDPERETREERTLRQVHIVRQSTIGYAIEFLISRKASFVLDDIVRTARFMEDYVFGRLTEQTDDEVN